MAPTKRRGRVRPDISIPTILLLGLLACLAVAGGASRADALGQAIVRVAAGAAIAGLIVVRGVPDLRTGHRWPAALLLATLAVPLLQLVPLPPSVWAHLPGHGPFVEAAAIGGMPQPWRPIAISPDAAWNAVFSLLVPAAALLLTAALGETERARAPAIVLGFATASAALAVLQLSGGLDNPFINETVGTASGLFANPNHQALLLAIGILAAGTWIAPSTAVQRRGGSWRLPVAGGAAIWFLLMIMASGSRTGLMLGFLALGIAVSIAWQGIAVAVARVPRRLRWVILALALALVVALAVVSFTAGRAVSLNRLLILSTGEDMRSRALPTVLHMIATYMPFGAGFGSFDPLFRMYEPDALLKLTYFNHAHSDYLEMALAGGVAGVVLMAVVIGWIVRAAIVAWRRGRSGAQVAPAQMGAATLVLVALASAVDYPARTPIIMALVALAAVLADPGTPGRGALRSVGDRV